MLHRDRVKARIVRYDRKGRPEGRVLEILERKQGADHRPPAARERRLAGRARRQALRPGHPDPEERASRNAKAGQVVAVELTEPPSMYSQPVGRVTEVLGEIDDPGMEIEIAVRKYEVPHEFSRRRRWRRPRRCPTRSGRPTARAAST